MNCQKRKKYIAWVTSTQKVFWAAQRAPIYTHDIHDQEDVKTRLFARKPCYRSLSTGMLLRAWNKKHKRRHKKAKTNEEESEKRELRDKSHETRDEREISEKTPSYCNELRVYVVFIATRPVKPKNCFKVHYEKLFSSKYRHNSFIILIVRTES